MPHRRREEVEVEGVVQLLQVVAHAADQAWGIELESLQDNVPPFEYSLVKDVGSGRGDTTRTRASYNAREDDSQKSCAGRFWRLLRTNGGQRKNVREPHCF